MKKLPLIHPFLFALFPILSLYAHSLRIMGIFWTDLAIPIVVSLGFTALFFLILNSLLKNSRKTGLIVTLFVFLFFSFGHFSGLAHGLTIGGVNIGRYRYLLLCWGALFFLGVYFTLRSESDLKALTDLMNLIGIFLVVMPLISAGSLLLSQNQVNSTERRVEVPGAASQPKITAAVKPDIYYIILDAYGRSDVLRDLINFDNQDFLDALTGLGFYVAKKSRANYSQTMISLSSSLNLKYHDDLKELAQVGSEDRKPLEKMIADNLAAKYLKRLGYTFVAFASGYDGTTIKNADLFINTGYQLSEFQGVLLNTTILPVLFKFSSKMQYDLYRTRILNMFARLPEIAGMDEPTFTFVHFLTPHPPFIFGENGEHITPDRSFAIGDGAEFHGNTDEGRRLYKKGYAAQAKFISKQVVKLVKEIIAESKIPPIIILQGDHGPASGTNWNKPKKINFQERMPIFNAYYLPGNGSEELYEGITPVNSFRLIFDRYFGADFELLEDSSYFSTYLEPYKFIDVTSDVLDYRG